MHISLFQVISLPQVTHNFTCEIIILHRSRSPCRGNHSPPITASKGGMKIHWLKRPTSPGSESNDAHGISLGSYPNIVSLSSRFTPDLFSHASNSILSASEAGAMFDRIPRIQLSVRPILGKTESAAWKRAHSILDKLGRQRMTSYVKFYSIFLELCNQII